MLSKEVKKVIQNLREVKEESKGKEITAASVYKDRENINKIWGDMPLEDNIRVEKINEEMVKGEFYHFDDNDPEKQKKSVLLFIHGGGFSTGSVLSRRHLYTGILQHAKMDAFSVKYGQWPEAVHPTALNDCVKAYRWLIEKGYSNENIHFFGESAGAMLTLTTILYLKDQGEPLPESACVFSPVAGQDIDLESHSSREERDPMISYESIIPYYEEADFSSPYVSPGYGDFKGFPKLSIHLGSEEVLYDDAILIKDVCEKADVDVSLKVWDQLFHVFPLFPCPETDVALEEIGNFFRED